MEKIIMEPLGVKVLIRRTEKLVKRKVILQDKEPDKYEIENEILALGEDCPTNKKVKVGDKVILSKYCEPQSLILISDKDNNKKRVFEGLIDYEEMIAITK